MNTSVPCPGRDELESFAVGKLSESAILTVAERAPAVWIVRGYQSKDKNCVPSCKANGRDITFTDGRKLFMGSSGTGAPRDGSDPGEGSRD